MINNETEIRKGNNKVAFADIKMGDEVIVKYTKWEGQNIAHGIAIKPQEQESKNK